VFLQRTRESFFFLSNAYQPPDLAVKYIELSAEQKTKIFRSFIAQLVKKDLIDSPNDIDDWITSEVESFDFNGRQIRNVVSTALGIALAEGRKLIRNDMAVVSKQTDHFKRDLSAQEAIYRAKQIESGGR
jgi:hypothetical protein